MLRWRILRTSSCGTLAYQRIARVLLPLCRLRSHTRPPTRRTVPGMSWRQVRRHACPPGCVVASCKMTRKFRSYNTYVYHPTTDRTHVLWVPHRTWDIVGPPRALPYLQKATSHAQTRQICGGAEQRISYTLSAGLATLGAFLGSATLQQGPHERVGRSLGRGPFGGYMRGGNRWPAGTGTKLVQNGRGLQPAHAAASCSLF